MVATIAVWLPVGRLPASPLPRLPRLAGVLVNNSLLLCYRLEMLHGCHSNTNKSKDYFVLFTVPASGCYWCFLCIIVKEQPLVSRHQSTVAYDDQSWRPVDSHRSDMAPWVHGETYTGCAKKSNPLGKIRYLWNCNKFFHQIYSVYRRGFTPHILQISLQYLVVFKNYNNLNLNVYFSKWTSN